jgi:uncharacterized membrane protein YdjX (TVP38/TMEM64 family)
MTIESDDRKKLAPAETAPRPLKALRRRAIEFVLALAVVLVGGFMLSGRVGPGAIASAVDGARALVAAHPVLSALGFSLLYISVTALTVPVVWLLSVAAGALFGPWFGLPIAVASGVAGGTITMLAARYAMRGWAEARFPEALARFDQGVARGGARFLFAARLTPVIPFALVNLGIGLTKMRARTFMLVSAVGYLPLTIAYVSAGASLGAIRSPAEALSPRLLITFVALAAAPFAAPAWAAWRSRRRRPSIA